jgi:hypothetical protein
MIAPMPTLKQMARGYGTRLGRVPMPLGWMFILGLSVFFAIFPEYAPFPALFFFLSAFLLSRSSKRKMRFFYGASLFFLFWYLVRTLFSLVGETEGAVFYPASFLVYVFLGLHLFFIWTPSQLGRGFKRSLSPILGERRALLTAISLMVLCLSIPIVLEDAALIRKTLRRFPDLPLKDKIALWGRNLSRITLDRAGILSGTLAKRQEDLM